LESAVLGAILSHRRLNASGCGGGFARPGCPRPRPRRLAVEAGADPVEHAEPGAAPPAALVGAGEAVPGQLDRRIAEGLGWERDRRAADHSQTGQLGVTLVQQIQRRPRAEAARDDAEARVADRIRD